MNENHGKCRTHLPSALMAVSNGLNDFPLGPLPSTLCLGFMVFCGVHHARKQTVWTSRSGCTTDFMGVLGGRGVHVGF